MGKKTVFIVNPNAAMGAVGKEWPVVRARARDRLGPFDEHFTSGMGDATRITRRSIQQGAERIVCVGGDGTLNEIVNGFMNEDGPLREEAILGFIPRGTGCDFKKTVLLPTDLEIALDLIHDAQPRPIDLGRVQFLDNQGRPCVRFFHNVASFGLGGEVDERVNRTSKAFGGFVSFIWATLISLVIFKNKRIHLKVDEGFDEQVTVLNVAVANGQFHGGGMWVAPHAVLDDGLFHVTVIGDFSLPEVFWHLPKLYNGKLLQLKKVRSFTGRRIEARSEDPVLLDVDGEQPGRVPVVIEMIPRVLPIIRP